MINIQIQDHLRAKHVKKKNFLKPQTFTSPGSISNFSLPPNSPQKKYEYTSMKTEATNDLAFSYSNMANTKNSDLPSSHDLLAGNSFQLSMMRDKKELSSSIKHKMDYPFSMTERTKPWELNKSANSTSTPKKTSRFSTLNDNKFDKKDDNLINLSTPVNLNPSREVNGKNSQSKNMNDSEMTAGPQPWESQKLLTLSDFWAPDSTKSEVEKLQIKLEEEKFRREHCEQLIQELQKRLLEQQEKVAVAMRVDKDKSDIISQFQTVWSKFKVRWNSLEADHNHLQENVKDIKLKHDKEIEAFLNKLKHKDEEIIKSNQLVREMEEKYDKVVKEKIGLLEDHANELEKYKSLVEAAEGRYETLKLEFNKLNETNQQLEETTKNIQQELYKERLKNGEVRTEMNVIHKALDTCEAELIVLRQEKENLQLKLKEEEGRVNILEKNKIMLLEELNNAKKAENLVKEEMKNLIAQQEAKKTELRDVYQKQLDEVVNTKLKEFEAQLDAAELNFQIELESKQRAIAECAARKIKTVIDKHRLEVNLLEEKHKEEKKLFDIRLSQTTKKALAYEAQLNSYQNAKSRLAEQLHSLMEKQYHQALQILSRNGDNFDLSQCTNGDKSFEVLNFMKNANYGKGIPCLEPMKSNANKTDKNKKDYSEAGQNYNESLATYISSDDSPGTRQVDSKDDLKKYIKMILQMHQSQKSSADSNGIDQNSSSNPVGREVPRKFYMKAESDNSNDENSSQKIAEETSTTINTDRLNYSRNT
ncbi:protein CROWDED NUCLEI 1 isoform X2 [Chelonus insularis]|uniref:protein CROWDED NUCLEI 1 isoform X2 n=1 Tax=Chelonus insularis TaxID=460826 RepID=UPI00158B61EC|nr:protein CROWDED NUCLEI 1 isoform X2 [Chelonus insularis]